VRVLNEALTRETQTIPSLNIIVFPQRGYYTLMKVSHMISSLNMPAFNEQAY